MLNGRDAGCDLDALVPEHAAVQNARRVAGGRRRGALQQQVVGVTCVARHLDRGTAVPGARIDPRLELLDAFRLDVRSASDAGDHRARGAINHHARERCEVLSKQGLVSGFTVGSTQLELRAVPQQVWKPIGGGRLGEDVVLGDVTVGARAFGT